MKDSTAEKSKRENGPPEKSMTENELAALPREIPTPAKNDGKAPAGRAPLVLAVLAALFIASRCLGILALPVYFDEAMHIYYAKQALAGDWLAGLRIGKWLTMQAYGIYFGFFPDTLLSARALVVCIGLANLLLVFRVSRGEGADASFRRGVYGALTYAAAPYALFFDRLLVADQLQFLLYSLVIIASFHHMRRASLFSGTALAALLCLCPLFKYSGYFLTGAPLLIAALAPGDEPPGRTENFKSFKTGLLKRLTRLAPVYLAAAPVLLTFFKFGRVEGEGAFTATSNWWCMPFLETYALEDARKIGVIMWKMLSPQFCALLLGGAAAVLLLPGGARAKRRMLAYALLALAVLAPYALFSFTCMPRYVFPAFAGICALSAEVMDALGGALESRFPASRRGYWAAVLPLAFLGAPACSSALLLAQPEGFDYCPEIAMQYFHSHTAGHGVKETAEFLGRLADEEGGRIAVLCPAGENLMHQGLEMYPRELGPHVQIRLYAGKHEGLARAAARLLKTEKRVYAPLNLQTSGYVFFKRLIPARFQVRQVWCTGRPGGNEGFIVWRLEAKR